MTRLPFLALIAVLCAPAAMASVPQVVTDIAPVDSLVAQVMGDLGQPTLLVTNGAEPHSYQLRPSQARALAGADLVFWDGPEMTPWLTAVLARTEARSVGLLAAKGTHVRQFNGVGGDETGTDPHAWLDPDNAQTWLVAIRDALIKADPDNTAAYTRNYDAAKAKLTALDGDLTKILASAGNPPIVVGHDAYGYFADHYHLNIAATIEAGDASEPGAAKLAMVASIVAKQGVRCMFAEAGHDPKRAAMLIEGTTARLGDALDPEGRLMTPGPQLYPTLMRDIATKIAACQKAG